MKPYPSYRDSGVEWIGDVPEHWKITRLKYLSQIVNGSTPKSGMNEYWDGKIVWITPNDLGKLKGNKITDSLKKITQLGLNSCGTTLTTKNSIILSTRAPIGHLGITKIETCTNQGCRTIVPDSSKCDNNFLFYYLYVSKDVLSSLGQGSTFIELSRQNLKDFINTLPPLTEQRSMTNYLDHKTSLIDELIEKTEKKIELLKGKRTSLINHCVTKGLNPNVEMKDSGIEWNGEIPKHWIVSKFKYLSEIVTGNTPSKTDEELYYTDSEDGFLWVKPTSLNKGLDYVNESEEHLTEEGKNQTRLIPKDSTMICCIGNTIGKHSISGQELSTNQQINSVIPNQQKLNPWFCLFYVNVFTRDLLKWSNFVTLPIYTKSDLEDTPFILPPIDEQDEIVNKLISENQLIDSTIEKETQRIELLKEYRQSLISEVVTGKIDLSADRQV